MGARLASEIVIQKHNGEEFVMTRKAFPPDLDLGAASPVGDRTEFQAAFDAVARAYPGVELTYVGTDGREHYFQRWGDKIAYAVPVSEGWCAEVET